MAVKTRMHTPGLIRHVVARGNGRMQIFLDDSDYRLFVFMLGEVVEEYDLKCWNYCLMPNHYHATLCPTLPNLSYAMQRLNGEYAKAWNRRHRRVGHVFQGRFKDQIVQNDRYLLAVSRYVALNPVRAQLVTKPEDWPWSSYAAICGHRESPAFLLVESTLRLFGDVDAHTLRARFSEFVLGASSDESPYDRIRSNEHVLGDSAFKRQIRGLRLKEGAPDPQPRIGQDMLETGPPG